MAETLTTIECSIPGDNYGLFSGGIEFDLHLAAPSKFGIGPCLCGFDRFARDEDGRFKIGFSVGGGTIGSGVHHNVCVECADLAESRPIRGTNAHLFRSESTDSEGAPDAQN